MVRYGLVRQDPDWAKLRISPGGIDVVVPADPTVAVLNFVDGIDGRIESILKDLAKLTGIRVSRNTTAIGVVQRQSRDGKPSGRVGAVVRDRGGAESFQIQPGVFKVPPGTLLFLPHVGVVIRINGLSR